MNQVEYDVQTTLRITKCCQEAQKTNEMSGKLVGIGETAIATTKAAVDMHCKQTQQNEEHLLKVIAEQQDILATQNVDKGSMTTM